MNQKTKVLFLSTGNSARSQMAEGFLRGYAADRFIAVSAGIESAALIPMAAEVMREIGIDISEQRSKDVSQSFKEHFGYVITLSDAAKERCPIFPFTPHLLHWSLQDPSTVNGSADQKREAFRRVRNEINSSIKDFVAQFDGEEQPQTMARAAGR